MSNLLQRFQNFRKKFGTPLQKISDDTGIDYQRLWRFSQDSGCLKDDDAVSMHKYLNNQNVK